MPEHHAGRLFDHVHLRVSDLEASRNFYTGALAAFGREVGGSTSYFSADELWVTSDGEPTERIHLAFQAEDREAVERFYEAALAAGGATMAGRESATITPATTLATCSIPTATTSRPFTTGRWSARRRRSCSPGTTRHRQPTCGLRV